MTEETVPERQAKRAHDLTPGDWIAAGHYGSSIDGTDDAKVLHCHRFPSSIGDQVAVMIQEQAITEPTTIFLGAGYPVPLLSRAEIDDALQMQRRDALVKQLRGIADLIQFNEVRVPEDWGAVLHVNFGAEHEAVRRAAEAIEVDCDELASQVEAVWPGGSSGHRGVLLSFSARLPQADSGRRPSPPTQAEIDAAKFAGSATAAAAQAYDDEDAIGLTYSRADDDPQAIRPISPARVPMHTGVLVDGGELVDVTPAEPVTVYFSFGHGHTDPISGEDLLDRYVTVIGPSVEACTEWMFASRYGDRWAFPYVGGTPQADEWIPRWMEHDRIDLTLLPAEPVSESR